ncbi:MAG: ribbon-helix-helix protein, CopG family [Planctomycetes bacterium]|nr:ribbon-helix-helix protein, CopG family [Planctomycetota bacterium]
MKRIKNKNLPYKPYSNISPVGFEHLDRTITKRQEERLRLLVEKTGRSISELIRETVESFN